MYLCYELINHRVIGLTHVPTRTFNSAQLIPMYIAFVLHSFCIQKILFPIYNQA